MKDVWGMTFEISGFIFGRHGMKTIARGLLQLMVIPHLLHQEMKALMVSFMLRLMYGKLGAK